VYLQTEKLVVASDVANFLRFHLAILSMSANPDGQ
jgi:hypothetical protein